MAATLRQFGDFRIVRRLGVGGMAETFEATRAGPGGFQQRVCLKRVLPAFSEDEHFVEQFQREARLVAALRHSNIVGVIDFGEHEHTHYMALELVDGIDLRAFLASCEGKRLTPEQVALVGLELAYALHYAHTLGGRGATNGNGKAGEIHGIVHRDVSPANVLISRAGEIKLADFGIAKAMSTAAATASQTIKGKIPYMAPEQMRGEAIDGRADLFSLGVLLFEAAAGRRPFDGSHDVETMTRILDGERVDLGEVAPELPDALRRVIEHLLAVDPAKRTPSAEALIDELTDSDPSPQVRRELAYAVEERLGGVATREHVREQRVLSGVDVERDALDSPIVSTEKSRARRVGLWLGVLGLCAAAMAAAEIVRSGASPDPKAPSVTIEPSAKTSALPEKTEPMVAPVVAAQPLATPTSETAPTETGSDLAKAAQQRNAREAVPAQQTATRERATKPTSPAGSSARPKRSTDSKGTAGKGLVRVVVVPYGNVWVDGRGFMGEAPTTVSLPAGKHKIRAGFEKPTKARTVRVRAGKRTEVEFELLD